MTTRRDTRPSADFVRDLAGAGGGGGDAGGHGAGGTVAAGAASVTILLEVDASFAPLAGDGSAAAVAAAAAAAAAKPVEVELDLTARYDASIIALTRAAGINIEADDDQLGIIFSLQHARSKFYVEGSMLCRGAKQDFWQNKVRPGDKFILRNEFERVDHTIALLKSALEGAVRLEHAASMC